MLTNEVIVYSLWRIWPVWPPKWQILTGISPPSAAPMVYTWHWVGLEVRVSDALWALCFTECDNECAASGVLSHSLHITQVTVFDLLYPCSSALCGVAPDLSPHQKYQGFIVFVSDFCGAGSFTTWTICCVLPLLPRTKMICSYWTATLFWSPGWWWIRLPALYIDQYVSLPINQVASHSAELWDVFTGKAIRNTKLLLCSAFHYWWRMFVFASCRWRSSFCELLLNSCISLIRYDIFSSLWKESVTRGNHSFSASGFAFRHLREGSRRLRPLSVTLRLSLTRHFAMWIWKHTARLVAHGAFSRAECAGVKNGRTSKRSSDTQPNVMFWLTRLPAGSAALLCAALRFLPRRFSHVAVVVVVIVAARFWPALPITTLRT